jgi:hypothetical protein
MNETPSLGTKAVAFTQQESLIDYAKENRIEVILVSIGFVVEGLEQLKSKIVYLSDSRNDKGSKDTIYKYQSAEQLLQEVRQLIKQMDQLDTCKDASNEGKNRRIAIYSLGSVLSSTIFSIAISNYYARLERTLYLNLDPYSILKDELLTNDGRGLTDLIYYLRQGEKDTLRKGSILQPLEGFTYIAPMQHYGDLNAMQKDDIEIICEQAIEKLNFSTIVVHLTEMNTMVEHYLQTCDMIFIQPNYFEVLDDRSNKFREMIDSTILGNDIKVRELPFLDTNQLSRQSVREFIFHNEEFIRCIEDLIVRE